MGEDMYSVGRPVSLTRKTIAAKCLQLYWIRGIKNISYNDIIKYSKLSKGSFYKLYKDEDDLHYETFSYYKENIVRETISLFKKCEDLFELLNLLKNWKYENFNYCYFLINNIEKNKLGKSAKGILKNIENYYRKELYALVEKHIDYHKINKKNVSVVTVSGFLFYGLSMLSILKRNKASNKDIIMYKNLMYDIAKNFTRGNNLFRV